MMYENILIEIDSLDHKQFSEISQIYSVDDILTALNNRYGTLPYNISSVTASRGNAPKSLITWRHVDYYDTYSVSSGIGYRFRHDLKLSYGLDTISPKDTDSDIWVITSYRWYKPHDKSSLEIMGKYTPSIGI